MFRRPSGWAGTDSPKTTYCSCGSVTRPGMRRRRVHRAVGSWGVHAFASVPRDIAPAYLSCYLTHPSVQDWIAQHTRRGVLPTINVGTVASLPLVLPPVAVQSTVIDVI